MPTALSPDTGRHQTLVGGKEILDRLAEHSERQLRARDENAALIDERLERERERLGDPDLPF